MARKERLMINMNPEALAQIRQALVDLQYLERKQMSLSEFIERAALDLAKRVEERLKCAEAR